MQAQDRFFQMDFRRHVTAGRLSELVGQDDTALQADKVVRTLGWRRVAEQELNQADPATRRYLDAYARGVNDYLRGRSPAELGLDYTVLGLRGGQPRIEPWTPLDSVSWFKAMAWDLRGNYDDELARARTFGDRQGRGARRPALPAVPVRAARADPADRHPRRARPRRRHRGRARADRRRAGEHRDHGPRRRAPPRRTAATGVLAAMSSSGGRQCSSRRGRRWPTSRTCWAAAWTASAPTRGSSPAR